MKADILVVDDEKEIRDMLARRYRLEGCRVETAADGIEALEILGRERFDVLISDIRMPRMNGVDLLRAVRDQYPMTRVVMITGYVTLENALACMRRGAETCIFKPLDDLTELDEAVRHAVETLNRWHEKLRILRGMKVAAGPGGAA